MLSLIMGNLACHTNTLPADSDVLPPMVSQLHRTPSEDAAIQLGGLVGLYRTESEEKMQVEKDKSTMMAVTQSVAGSSPKPSQPKVKKSAWTLSCLFGSDEDGADQQAPIEGSDLDFGDGDLFMAYGENYSASTSSSPSKPQKVKKPKAPKAPKASQFVDDRVRFGLSPLKNIPYQTQLTISTMSLDGLFVELGSLTGISSLRLAELETIAKAANEKVAQMKKVELEMKSKHVTLKIDSHDEASPSNGIVIGSNAPVAPPLSSSAAATLSVSKSSHPPSQQPWSKGVGYGYSGAAGSWNIDTYLAGLKSQQETIQFVLRKIGDRFDDNEDVIYDHVAQSTLVPFLQAYLCNDSMNEILEQKSDLYCDIFRVIAHILAYSSPNVSPFVKLFEGKIRAYLKKIAKSAETIEKMDEKGPTKAAAANEASLTVSTSASSSSSSSTSTSTSSLSSSSSSSSPIPGDTVTQFIIDLSRTLDMIIEFNNSLASANVDEKSLPAIVEPVQKSDVNSAESEEFKSNQSIDEVKAKADLMAEYTKQLSECRFGEVEEFVGHKYMSKSSSSSSAPISRAFTRRLAVEYADMAESLPIHFASSVWMRVHESQMQYAQMMISGPDNTPYENGLFVFDIHFPPSYPNVPPQVNLMTTGKGAVRFNPNLYNCGKVCLSILGTWPGGVGEGWSTKSSTMLQVAVSIQSLIFVEQPYFNEPSYEKSMHTKHGQEASAAYSKPLLQSTMKWAILDQLQNPPKGFEDVVKRHFALKKKDILAQANKWSEINPDIKSLIPQLTTELDKLDQQ